MLNREQLRDLVVNAIEDVKGVDIRVFDVQDKSSVTDIMIVASGNTARQVKALADNVIEKAKTLLVATGASEKVIPFPGNDIPGVYGAGAIQTLMNVYGIPPGKKVLM